MNKEKVDFWVVIKRVLIVAVVVYLVFSLINSEDAKMEKKLKDAYNDAYNEGYKAAEFENRSAWEIEAFSEGYSAALEDYNVEETVHIECPHCGINISADHDGYVNDWWW